MWSSDQLATISFSSGYLPKKCSRTDAPSRAERLGLVHLAVADKAPHLAVLGVSDAAVVQVLHEARLVDRLDRPEPHGHGRELTEGQHHPQTRICRPVLAI